MADCGAAITALAVSPDDSICVVGGRDLLKLYALARDGSAPLERKNLRAGCRKTLDLSTSDVRWHPALAHVVAMASTTGAVLLWDLTKPKGGGGDAAFRHERTVNRVCWHPSESAWLLTCSQDATVRLWDARCAPTEAAGGAVAVFGYRYAPGVGRRLAALRPDGGAMLPVQWQNGAGVAVRDVQFQPFHPFSFAAGGDDGTSSLWDVRRPGGSPHAAFSAHSGLVLSLQWHPTCPGVLATGGRDRLVQVWHVDGGGGGGGGAASASAGPAPEHAFVRTLAQRTAALAAAAAAEDGCGGGAADAAAPPTPPSTAESGGARCIATVQTLSGVSRLAWRPVLGADVSVAPDPAWGEDGDGEGGGDDDAHHAAAARAAPQRRPAGVDFQLATCAALLDRQVHVWDLRDAFFPAAVVSGHRDVVAGVAWVRGAAPRAPPWLVSAGKDGRLNVHDPARAQRPRRALCAASVASSATDLAWFGRAIDRDRFWDAAGGAAAGGEQDEGESKAEGGGGPAVVTAEGASGGAETFSVLGVDPLHARRGGALPPASVAAAAPAARLPLSRTPPPPLPALAAVAFDPPAHLFAILALTYVTDGAPPHELCAWNAAVADGLGLPQTAQVWRVFGAAFAPPPPPPPAAKAGAAGGPPGAAPPVDDGRGAGSSGGDRPAGEPPALPGAAVGGGAASAAGPGEEPGAPAAAAAATPAGSPPQPQQPPQLQQRPVPQGALAAEPRAPPVVATVAAAAAAAADEPVFLAAAALRRHLAAATATLPAPVGIPGVVTGLLDALLLASAPRPPAAAAAVELRERGALGGVQRGVAADVPPPSAARDAAAAVMGAAADAAAAATAVVSAAAAPPALVPPPTLPPPPAAAAPALPVHPGGPQHQPLPLPGALATPPGRAADSVPPATAALAAAGWRAFWLETAVDVLRYYADAGDVQLCVTLARVLGVPVSPPSEAPAPRGAVPRALMKAWLVQYIEQLHRLQLWSPASTVIARAGDELVRSLNQLHTALAAACARCKRDVATAAPPVTGGGADDAGGGRAAAAVAPPLRPPPGAGLAFAPVASPPAVVAGATDGAEAAAGAAAAFQPAAARRCGGCGDAALACAVCSAPVRGAYVWCQGCGHGGHLGHMLAWFSRSSLCPSGCMHVCDLAHAAPHG